MLNSPSNSAFSGKCSTNRVGRNSWCELALLGVVELPGVLDDAGPSEPRSGVEPFLVFQLVPALDPAQGNMLKPSGQAPLSA